MDVQNEIKPGTNTHIIQITSFTFENLIEFPVATVIFQLIFFFFFLTEALVNCRILQNSRVQAEFFYNCQVIKIKSDNFNSEEIVR